MKVGCVSSVYFGNSQNVRYFDVPEKLQKNEAVLDKFAKDNSVILSISKASETKYLPRNDMYTIIAKRLDRSTGSFLYEVSILLPKKGDTSDSVLKELNERAAIATINLQKQFVDASTEVSQITETKQNLEKTCVQKISEKTKKTCGQNVKDFFKKLWKK